MISFGQETIMRFFHLADLHLGKCIHGYSMIEMGDQPYWAEQLLKKAEQLRPDAVLISGDVYDRAVPSKDAVKLFDHLLTRLAEMKIAVLIIAGNHDSGSRLAFADQLLCHQGIYIAGKVKKEISCVTLEDSYGPVHFWMLPYFFPAAANAVLNRDDLKDYESAVRALLEGQPIDFSKRNVILSHQFVVCGSEKPKMGGSETTVGGIGQIDSAVFEKFDYAALGHIHNAQHMGRDHIRYAGSPLNYHFSEIGQQKGLTVVEIEEKGNVKITIEALPILHKMCEIAGTMEEILQSDVPPGCYVRAVIRQQLLPPQAVEILRQYFDSKDCVLMEAVRDISEEKKKGAKQKRKDIRTLSLEELFEDFYSHRQDGSLPDAETEKLISFAAEQTRNSSGDETEKERTQAAKQLIEYAKECQHEEMHL